MSYRDGAFLDAIRSSPPYVVSIELTYRCPMQCLYCHNPPERGLARLAGARACSVPIPRSYDKRYSNELDTTGWIRIVRKVAGLGPYNFVISGGEPLLRRDVYDIIGESVRSGLDPLLLTSGSIYSEDIAYRLRSSGLRKIRVNLSSHSIADLANMERFRRAVRERIRAVEIYKSVGLYVQVGILYVKPYTRIIEELVGQCIAGGADLVEIHHMARFGHGLYNHQLLWPDYGDILAVKDLRKRLLGAYGDRVFFAVDPDILAGKKPYPNLWGLVGLVIAPDGTIYPSEEAVALGEQAALGNALVDDIAAIWASSPLLNKFRSLEWLGEPCRSCPIRETCRGGSRFMAYMLAGDLFAPDPTCPMVMDGDPSQLGPHSVRTTPAPENLLVGRGRPIGS